MNCHRFQNDLHEYLDGSLAPGDLAAAKQHLSECVGCREKLKEERQVAQVMGGTFHRATESLELPPLVGRRVLAELAKEACSVPRDHGSSIFWHRLAWPLALAALVLLLLGLWIMLPRGSAPGSPGTQRSAAGREISVQLSYVVPAYKFKLESGFVIDALSYHTNVVNERLPAHPAYLP